MISGEVTAEYPHVPVMAEPVLQYLVTDRNGVYIDGTVGAGGHAELILSHLEGQGRLLGLDRDPQIISIAEKRLQNFGSRAQVARGSYENLESWMALLGVRSVDGILLDLGVSSLQLDQKERGFSFRFDAPLDMRMDPDDGLSAEELIKGISEKDLERVLREWGEDPFARRIARVLVEERRRAPIRTTAELAHLVSRAIPKSARSWKTHPATRTFQALRIEVNQELKRLDSFLEKVPEFLNPGGRVVVLSYHSLEDRRVKHSFLKHKKEGTLNLLMKKPQIAAQAEIRLNPRARSVKMRVAERV